MMCQPWNEVEVTILPHYAPSPAELQDSALYAENVRQLFSKHLGMPLVQQVREQCIRRWRPTWGFCNRLDCECKEVPCALGRALHGVPAGLQLMCNLRYAGHPGVSGAAEAGDGCQL